MDCPSPSDTSPTLLGRLRQSPPDKNAWGEFVDRYGPKVLAWCRRWGLQEADAENVTQELLLKLVQLLPCFDYDRARSFRGWLKTLARHARSDVLSGGRRAGLGSGDSQVHDQLNTREADADFEASLKDAFDMELRDEAYERVRLRLRHAPKKWEAFCLTAVEGRTGAEVAARLGITVGTVYKYRTAVQALLRQEIRDLEGPDAEPEEPPCPPVPPSTSS